MVGQVQIGSTVDVAIDPVAEICCDEPIPAQPVGHIPARAEHLLLESLRGKRFRPLVAISAAKFGDQPARWGRRDPCSDRRTEKRRAG
ncbi:hypothetical protein [Nocardia asiatica]|uniref:hypothetical protein n=1 Tax=Nocardia asiatica TaxID=209252 RepID=UPI002453A862|nr:hypothetical protein [Nocardia asiatica]